MSYPDTEDRAKEVEKHFPLAAARLRQYAKLTQTQEAALTELQGAYAALAQENASLKAANDTYLEQSKRWRELPEVKPKLIAEAAAQKAAAEATLAELTTVKALEEAHP